MNLRQLVGAWKRLSDLEWAELEPRVSEATSAPPRDAARARLDGWFEAIVMSVLVAPAAIVPILQPVARLHGRAVSAQQGEVDKYLRITTSALGVIELGNALECVGVALAPESWATMREWLPRMEVSRNDERAAYWWTAAFAALALDEPLRFRKAAALTPDEPNPFVAGATFEFNMQALLRHLAGAIATGATFEDVQPAWENLLLRYGDMRGDASVDEGTLLWIARLVFHRIGGRPLGEVAQALHDSAWSLAGLDP